MLFENRLHSAGSVVILQAFDVGYMIFYIISELDSDFNGHTDVFR